MKETLAMTDKERDRLQVMKKVKEKEMTLREASNALSVSYRQTLRIRDRYVVEGDKGLVHRSRGKPSHNGYLSDVRENVLSLYQEKYYDFGPLLFSEKLEEDHGIQISDETVRLWLLKARVWSKKRKCLAHRKYREPKQHFGELVQLDGSSHRWFSKRKRDYCLMNMVDDATGKNVARFDYEETTESAMRTLWRWIERYGIPRALYVDKKNVYVPEKEHEEAKKLEGIEVLTHFGKACKALGIKIIRAYSPQAKGRVERKNGVHQDRLVKELRVNGINDSDEANRFLDAYYLDAHNRKFEKVPKARADYHKPVPEGMDLRRVFCIETKRVLGNDWTINFKKKYYQITKVNEVMPRPKDTIIVSQWLDGSVHLMYKGTELAYEVLTQKPERKIEAAVIKKRKKNIPGPDHPWRKWYVQKRKMYSAPRPPLSLGIASY